MKKAENCIFLLTRGYKYGSYRNYKFLIRRNRVIVKFLKSSQARGKGWNNFELIIFHEGNIGRFIQIILCLASLKKLRFIDIQEDFRLLKTNVWTGKSEMPLQYSLMCQFQYFHLWKYLKDYKISCRIDEDIIVRTFPSLKNEFKFIAGSVFPETHQLTNDTFPIFLSKLQDEHFYDHDFPLTNFYVTKPKLWLTPEISKYLSQIVNDKNSANYRWGDVPVLGVVLHKFMGWKTEDGILREIEYFHGSHNAWVRGGVQIQSS
jgi:hypothetical protein